MKVSIIGTVGLPACYGGWETLVENIVKCKSSSVQYTVYCSSKNYTKRINDWHGTKLVYLPISANGISSIFYDIFSMLHTWFTRPKVVLILGVSGCVFLPIYKLFTNSKIIVNVDGIEWKRDKWSKFAKSFLKLSESIAVKYADVVVADNKGISDYIESQYKKKSKVIAYGGEHVIVSSLKSKTNNYFFTVCRIEPENNIDMILEAFSVSGYNYKLVGNWGASEYGKNLKNKYGHIENIELIEPVYDLNILFNYRNECKGYIHGHSVGGTNPSLVEAMHFGKKIYAYDCDFNRYTTEDNALYFSSVENLNNLLNKNSDIDENQILKEIAVKRYTWPAVTLQYELMYGDE